MMTRNRHALYALIPIILFILSAQPLFAANFGRSLIRIERTWTVLSPQGSHIDFDGALVLNDSNQHVVSIATEPPMDIAVKDDGSIRLHYSGIMNAPQMKLKGTAVVDVDYDTDLSADPPLPPAQTALNFTNITMPDEPIRLQAKALSQGDSTLSTIRNLVDWVHNDIAYNISCWDQTYPAAEVFQLRQGVCVEYSHLLISMARSLGLDTRYVGGYVYSNSWQPHAWVEIMVPGYGWLPADPTFDQAGILDSSHIGVSEGEDQASNFDLLLSEQAGAVLEADDVLEIMSSVPDPKGASISMAFDNNTYVVTTSINNSNPRFVFGLYDMATQDGYLSGERALLLLQPSAGNDRFYILNRTILKPNFIYDIPLQADFNDAHADLSIEIAPPSPSSPSQAAEPEAPQCLLPAVLLLMAVLAVVVPWALSEFISVRRLPRLGFPKFLKGRDKARRMGKLRH